MRDMVIKLSQYFYMLMEKPPGCYFQVQSPYYQAAVQPENTRSGLRIPKKDKDQH